MNFEEIVLAETNAWRRSHGMEPLPAPVECDCCGKRICVCNAESESRSRMSEREEDVMLDDRERGEDMRGSR